MKDSDAMKEDVAVRKIIGKHASRAYLPCEHRYFPLIERFIDYHSNVFKSNVETSTRNLPKPRLLPKEDPTWWTTSAKGKVRL